MIRTTCINSIDNKGFKSEFYACYSYRYIPNAERLAQRSKPSDNKNEENRRKINCLINIGFISEYPVSTQQMSSSVYRSPDRYTPDEVCWAQRPKRCKNNKDAGNILHVNNANNENTSSQKSRQKLFNLILDARPCIFFSFFFGD